MAERDEYDGPHRPGCVIRGDDLTTLNWCANESGAGVTRVSLDTNTPIANAILTVENVAQAVARQEEKGRDAARVAIEMAHLLEQIG